MKLLFYGSEALSQAENQRVVDFELVSGVKEVMLAMMERFHFIGLAAPQIGIPIQMIVVKLESGEMLDLVNPEITRMYGTEPELMETCISCPPVHNHCLVARIQNINVEAQTVHQETLSLQTWSFQGRDSRVVQHEIDHLTGTFFFDRASLKDKQTVLEEFKGWKREWTKTGKKFPY